jgi:uncharacterized small protein (DUF1192 family)
MNRQEKNYAQNYFLAGEIDSRLAILQDEQAREKLCTELLPCRRN